MKRREEIEQQAKSYTLVIFDELEDFSDVTQAYIDGAEWADKTMIEKACKWVENHIFDFPWYDNEQDDFSSKDIANALRKAMEE